MSSFVPIDQEVRERIRTDLDANLCVEAGAGTGKTTVLVERVVEVLRTGRATVDGVAVITFTEAAAAELAGRVRQGLEAAHANASDEGERARIRAALRDLHRAHIETIHAFAASMLRERPVEAGLDPQFEVLDDLAAQLHFTAAYERWLLGVLSEERPEIVTAIRRGFDLEQLRRLVATVHAHRSLLPLAREHAPGVTSGFVERMHEAAERCRRLLAHAGTDEIGAADMEAIVAFARALDAVRHTPEELDREILYRAPRLRPHRGSQTKWSDPALCRESKALRSEVVEAIDEARDALRTEAIVGLLPLAEGFVAGYEDARRAEGVADFDDLLEWARDLLVASPEARAHFRRRFPVILVDEFQDTDPVQAEIVLLLASDADPADDWLALAPRPGGLTVVGDPKQSIYRFRRADIAVYDAVRHGPLAAGDAPLVQNFRSVGGILSWANEVFDRLLVEKRGVQPAHTALQPGDARLGDESLSVCVVHGEVVLEEGQKLRVDDTRAEEARLLAMQIRQAVESGWMVRDRLRGDERPATYGDVAVLLPRRTAVDIYLDAFRRAGVPVQAEGGRSFFQRQEVRDLANVLRAVDDPLDQVALVACLRSSAFGCSDQDIFLHHAAGNRLDYRLEHSGGPASVAEAMAVLRHLHDLRSRVSLGAFVRAVLQETRLVEIALAGWDGQQSAANLLKLADRARAFSASGAGGLRAFARWLAEQRAASDEAEAGIAEETDDVVRIMTIHAAKGLEFPIVALANLHARPRAEVEPVPDRRARRLHVRIRAGEHTFTTPGFTAAWEGEKEQQEAEERRLLYVAVTRARDHLIVPVVRPTETAGPMLTALLRSLPAWDPARAGTAVDGCFVLDGSALPPLPEEQPPLRADASPGAVEAALADRRTWGAARAELLRRASDALEVHPATKDEGDDPLPAPLLGADDRPLIVGESSAPARLTGEALHRALELIDLVAPATIEETVRAACILAGVEEAVADVTQMVEACLASPVASRARAAAGLWREVPYTLRVDDGYATGRIDLVFREGDRLVVVDWKSDTIGPGQADAAAAAHRPQAEAYVRALEQATGMRVTEVVFVFARAGEERAFRPQESPTPPAGAT
jgi:ATP-dependent exoDNAse (exonuclease V) beta subunit